jgi:HPt (histidine-containing phosphotransfer) domain-containing protein
MDATKIDQEFEQLQTEFQDVAKTVKDLADAPGHEPAGMDEQQQSAASTTASSAGCSAAG